MYLTTEAIPPWNHMNTIYLTVLSAEQSQKSCQVDYIYGVTTLENRSSFIKNA